MHFAVTVNSEEIVEILMAAGADSNVRNWKHAATLVHTLRKYTV